MLYTCTFLRKMHRWQGKTKVLSEKWTPTIFLCYEKILAIGIYPIFYFFKKLPSKVKYASIYLKQEAIS